ncbi:sensor histidine kinase [Paenibacillus odorifer]|uniref:sensor histidine kinase n=1 Tax=Paenibacillus TaxID=44249 RepID=UPI00096D1D12|nr:sensor histidine kinase [Paenibacillus odorifer]OME57555.1 sensor histidine kinase [Paenibacillus odorifer]
MKFTFKEEKIYVNLVRFVGSLLLAISYYKDYSGQGFINLLGGLIVLLLYMVLIWAKNAWWTEVKYYAVTFIMILIILVLHYVFGSPNTSLLWPLYFIILFMNRVYPRVSFIVGITTFTAVFLIYSLSLSGFLGLLCVILVARSIKIRRDAHYLTTLHLEELNKTHKELEATHNELQEAMVHSVRYAALEERTRLASEIHDGLGHQLTSLIVQLQALQIMQVNDPKRAAESTSQLITIARQAMAEVRVAVKEWSNDEMGLGLVALKGLVAQTQSRSSIHFKLNQKSEVTEWPIETSIVLYRVLQESLTNVLRHSNATIASIDIEEVNDTIYLTVTDNGVTAKEEPLNLGYGLNGVTKRCKASGGYCFFSSIEPHGFRLQAVVPVACRPIVEEKE